MVLVADPAGFAMVAAETFFTNKSVTLQSWGKITGTAQLGSQLPKYVTLFASLPVATFPGQRKVGIEFDTSTDAAGQFVFDHVPPGNVGVGFGNEGTSIRGTNIRFGSGVLQTVAVAPGTTVELNLSSSELSAAPKSASQLEMERMQAQMQAQMRAQRGRRNELPDPEPPLIGTVLSVDGRPVEGALVVRWGMGIGLEISNAAVWADTRNLSRWATNPLIANPNRVAFADTQGYFVLPAMIDNSVNSRTQWVIATRFDGYASATAESVKASRPITLRPWGRIEGTLRFGNAPVTNALVRLEASALNLYVASAISATTDASGRFVLSNVPPERFTLFWKVQSGSSRGETGTSRPVDVRSGEITTVALGGAGRPVTGKLVASSPVAGLDWTRARITLQSIPPAARVSSFYFVPALFDDGSFRFDDVPPGTYELSATLSAGSTPGFSVDALRQTTAVPEITGGPADQALDLGAVKMNISFPPEVARVGETAPSLQATDLNGQPVKLADFRGKYVLVRLLGSQGSQAGSLAVAMARAYANDPRLMVMTVGLTPEAMESIARAEGLQNGAPMVYAYTGSPRFSDSQTARTMFVAPDGKLIAADLHGEEIREAVAHALGSGPTNQGLGLALDDGITGTVLLPDGKPAAGAMIGISGNGFDPLGLDDDGLNRLQLSGTRLTTSSSERRQAMLGQQQNQNRPPAANAAFDRLFPPPDYTKGPIVLADAAGKFHIPAKMLGQSLFVAHEKGFARLGPGRVDSAITIQLEAWGRIEGTIGGGRRAESNEAYSLSQTLPLPVYTHTYQTSTSRQGRGPSISPDQAGNFTFTNVAPGEYDVMRLGSVANSSYYAQTIAHVVVKAGAVTRLDVGDVVPPRGLLRGRSNVPSASGGSGLPVPGNPVITNTAQSTNVDSQGSNPPATVPPSSRGTSN